MVKNPFPSRCFMRIFVLCSIKHLSQVPQAAARIVLAGYKENINIWQVVQEGYGLFTLE